MIVIATTAHASGTKTTAARNASARIVACAASHLFSPNPKRCDPNIILVPCDTKDKRFRVGVAILTRLANWHLPRSEIHAADRASATGSWSFSTLLLKATWMSGSAKSSEAPSRTPLKSGTRMRCYWQPNLCPKLDPVVAKILLTSRYNSGRDCFSRSGTTVMIRASPILAALEALNTAT